MPERGERTPAALCQEVHLRPSDGAIILHGRIDADSNQRSEGCFLRAGRLEVDISNFFPTCIPLLYPDKDLCASRKYDAQTQIWRMAVAEYYEISIGERKRY